MAMDKDRQIITQVAAKIAADLVNREQDTTQKLAEFTVIFSQVMEIIFDTIEAGVSGKTAPNMAEVLRVFPGATEVPTAPQAPMDFSVTIVGQQHGDLPDWLIAACKRDGTTRVYDNRDGLAENPKRPWFKAVETGKGYWAPRTRTRAGWSQA
jgi:hypothetical protein